jgi:hypothetical protein
MTSRYYDYRGTCGHCGEPCSRRIQTNPETTNPGPEQWLKCADCREITLVKRVTASEQFSSDGSSV